MPFATQSFDGQAHQVHGAKSVMKPCVQSAGIDQMRHSQLLDIAQPLEIRVLNKVEYQLGGDTDKTINRVVNYFLFVQLKICSAKMSNYSNKVIVNC